MRRSNPELAVRRGGRTYHWLSMVVVLVPLASTPCPNAVVSGSRPAPYGFCIPSEDFATLRHHHSVAVWLPRPLSAKEFCSRHYVSQLEFAALRSFNLELGLELPDVADAEFPAGVPIWLPPMERTASTCCVSIWSLRDGWVSAQSDGFGLRDVTPTYAHAASDSGGIDVAVYPVPVALQREWQKVARTFPPRITDDEAQPEISRELREAARRWRHGTWDPSFHFAFSQWVSERSNVARIIVTLPIAEVAGTVQFAVPPTVHWLDAYGKETSPQEPMSSSMVQILVSVTGGALLAYLFLASRRRKDGARS